ncbi:MAG: DUF3987 domain-containing protein, partial [Candidatus Acidiferrum sp.]
MPTQLTARLTHEQLKAILTKSPGGRRDEYVCPVCEGGHLALFGADGVFCWKDDSESHQNAVIKKLHELVGNGHRHVPRVMPKPSSNGSHPAQDPNWEGYTPAQYAADKKLSLNWLLLSYSPDLRVPTPMQGALHGKPFVKFAYMNEDREVVFTRRRFSADSKPRSEPGSEMSIPYGLWLPANKADKKGRWPRVVVVCEGESDQQTLTMHGVPAIGVPGVNNWKAQWADLSVFRYAQKILVIQEPSMPGQADVGKKFVATVASSFPKGKVLPLKLAAKDPSDLHIESEIGKEFFGDQSRPFMERFVTSVREAYTATKQKLDWPAPMSEDAFYGLAGRVVERLSPHVESDRVALLANFLCMAGVLFGREAWAEVGATRHYPFEFITLVGDSSRSRKGTSTNLVLSVVERVEEAFEKDRVISGLSTGEGLIQGVQDKDESLRNRGFLVKLGEFSALLEVMKRESNTMSSALRQAWDGERLRVMTRKDPLDVDNVSLSVIAHITQTELLNKLTTTDRVNGFANRFLIVCTKRDKKLPSGGGKADIADLVREIRIVVEAAKGKEAIARSQAAESLWAQEYDRLTEGGDSLKDALCARAEAHVLRLSLIYALLDSSSEIRPEHIRAAVAFWDYCERSVE